VGNGWVAQAVGGAVDMGGWRVVAGWLVGWCLARLVDGLVVDVWDGGALD